MRKTIVRMFILGVICSLLFAISNVGCLAAEEGFVGYWPMDEGQGDIIKDKSGNDNHGKILGAVWAEGKFGKALDFNGVDSSVEVPASPSLNITEALTIAAWVYNRGDNRWECIVGKKLTDGIVQYGLLKQSIKNAHKVMFEYGLPSGRWQGVRGNDFPVNRWVHVAVTVKGLVCTFYIDGQPAGNGRLPNAIPSMPFVPVTFSYYRHGNKVCWNGLMDEVKIYNRALSQEKILKMINKKY